MDTLQFLKELKLQKIDISLKDDNLELSFDGELSGAIVAQIRERKNEILDFLKNRKSPIFKNSGKSASNAIKIGGITFSRGQNFY